MTKDSLLDSLEYDENAPDVKSIMTQIRAHLARSGATGETTAVVRHGPSRLGPGVYQELEQARNELGNVHVSVYVTPARVPIMGSVMQPLRRAMHQLVVYYVDRMADAQTRINSRLVRVLTAVVTQIDGEDQSEQVRSLEARVHELESRIERLETALGQAQSGQNQ